MRIPFAILCLALALAGCRGTGGGLFGQMTIPPPGTQPQGTLLAGNSYYPGATSTLGGSTLGAVPSATTNLIVEPSFASASNSPPTERRGASLSRASLGAPSSTTATTATASREEPVRIPDESTSVGGLAAVVPIRGIPMTDATSLFDTIRSTLAPPSSLAAKSPASSGFVEISQLPDVPAALRRAALSGQSLR